MSDVEEGYSGVRGDVQQLPAKNFPSEVNGDDGRYWLGWEEPTPTYHVQKKTEKVISDLLNFYEIALDEHEKYASYELKGNLHCEYLLLGLVSPKVSNFFHSNQSWIVYWILHALELLENPIPYVLKLSVIDWISLTQSATGGFGGGPGQMSHLAASYANILSIGILGEDAYRIVNRPALYSWLMSLKQPDGSFLVNIDGEIDVRGSYCALVLASLTNLMTADLIENVGEFIESCQSYEGGIGALPGREAHGGYTYCGLSALFILNQTERLDLASLTYWAVMRQKSVEGAFQGRTNKLVDGCYSWWLGALFPILDQVYINRERYQISGLNSDDGNDNINKNQNYGFYQRHPSIMRNTMRNIDRNQHAIVKEERKDSTLGSEFHYGQDSSSVVSSQLDPNDNSQYIKNSTQKQNKNESFTVDQYDPDDEHEQGSWLFDQLRLQRYLLVCCQDLVRGGLKDKPQAETDYYHTCYCLSGMSIAQNNAPYSSLSNLVLGDNDKNYIRTTDVIYNICPEKVIDMKAYYKSLNEN